MSHSRSRAKPGQSARWFVVLVAAVMVGYWFVPSLAHASGGGSSYPSPTVSSEDEVLGAETTRGDSSLSTPTPNTSSSSSSSSSPTASSSNNGGISGEQSAVAETTTATASPVASETATPTSQTVEQTADVLSIISVIPKPDCDCPLLSRIVTPTPAPSTPTPTPKAASTSTPTPTKKTTPTPTPTKKVTATPTPSKKATGTPTPTKKTTSTPTPTPKAASTSTPTPTKKATSTPTPTHTSTPTPTPVYEYYYDPECVAAHSKSSTTATTNAQGQSVLGAYSCSPLSAVSGWLFNDSNQNGKRDEGEIAYVDVKVELWKKTKQDEILETQTSTDAQGYWQVELSPGEYRTHFAEDTFPAGVSIPQSDQTIVVTDDSRTPGKQAASTVTQVNELLKTTALLLAIPLLIAIAAGVTLWRMRRKFKQEKAAEK